MHLTPWGNECIRNSEIDEEFKYMKNKKKIDDFCEDVAYIVENISEIHSNVCKEIKTYIVEQITILKPIYTTSGTKYSDILGYYKFI
ncbi:hypothetical protein POVCU2_0052680 [Plasmodium ovale curtisi]|uniref:PIR Superfamily Protein n=1 Tax=Plasmodium ovale curtisi TaxID=864141 RepID=A0A1A8W8L0_PLAOA|nr:hypothetical protein POVCU2_0052680 [Plasmodium ovale curtisi]